MKRKTVFIVAILVILGILAVGGYIFWKTWRGSGGVGTSSGVPALTNPLENAPSVNPMDKANPFSSLKTNPFER